MEQNTLTGTASYSEAVTDAKGKQRRTAHRTTLEVPLRSATSEQASVAALISGNREFKARWPRHDAEIRTLDGQLYSQTFDTQGWPLKPGGEYLDRHLHLSFSGNRGLEKAQDAIRRGLGKYLLIDGEIWTSINEPHIRIGAGSRTLDITSTNSDHIGAHRLFALTEFDAAVTAQKEFNEQYGFHSPAAGTVEILIPSAFTMATSTERVQAARDTASAKITSLWLDRSASSIHAAGLALMKVAGELATQTGEPLFGKTGAADV